MERAADINDAVLRVVLDKIRVGMTENLKSLVSPS